MVSPFGEGEEVRGGGGGKVGKHDHDVTKRPCVFVCLFVLLCRFCFLSL